MISSDRKWIVTWFRVDSADKLFDWWIKQKRVEWRSAISQNEKKKKKKKKNKTNKTIQFGLATFEHSISQMSASHNCNTSVGWADERAKEMEIFKLQPQNGYHLLKCRPAVCVWFKLWNGVEVLRDILVPLLPLLKVMRMKYTQPIYLCVF